MSATPHVEVTSIPGYSGMDRREIVAEMLNDCPWLAEFGLRHQREASLANPLTPDDPQYVDPSQNYRTAYAPKDHK